MAMVMPGLLPAPKGRVRTQVGHRYLEALQSKVAGLDGRKSLTQSETDEKGEELSLRILGLTSGTAMDDIDFALCHFTQANPDAPLCLDIIKVRHEPSPLH
jgi:hypothetical protein